MVMAKATHANLMRQASLPATADRDDTRWVVGACKTAAVWSPKVCLNHVDPGSQMHNALRSQLLLDHVHLVCSVGVVALGSAIRMWPPMWLQLEIADECISLFHKCWGRKWVIPVGHRDLAHRTSSKDWSMLTIVQGERRTLLAGPRAEGVVVCAGLDLNGCWCTSQTHSQFRVCNVRASLLVGAA